MKVGMIKTLAAIFALALSSSVCAQDFLQQWRDSATKGMNEFRSAHKAGIEANGWHFVADARSAEEVPISDVFVREVKTGDGSIRSAVLLNVFYTPMPGSDSPEYQSTKALVWINCKQGSYEQRNLERYASADGSGNPVSTTAEKPGSEPIELPGADARSIEKPLLAAVCSAKVERTRQE